MLLVSSHMIPVVGLDFHISGSGNPFHPYIGLVIDPADYIPFLGSDVHINGLKRGVSDTSGVLLTYEHIPLVGPFVMMPVIGHESMNFYSSEHTFADETRLSPKGRNIYRDKERKDKVYDRGGRLLKDKEYYYRYDGEGNLILKSPRNILEPPIRPEPKYWLDKLFTRTKPSPEELQKHYSWQEGDTAYE